MSLKCNKCEKELKPEEYVYQVRLGYMIPTDEGVEFEPSEDVLIQHDKCVKLKLNKERTVKLVPDFV